MNNLRKELNAEKTKRQSDQKVTRQNARNVSLLSLSRNSTSTHKPQNGEWRNRLETLTLVDIGGHLTHLHRIRASQGCGEGYCADAQYETDSKGGVMFLQQKKPRARVVKILERRLENYS